MASPILPMDMEKNLIARLASALAVALIFFSPLLGATGVAPSDRPRVVLLDATYLSAVRKQILEGDPSLAPALEQLRRDAKKALAAGPFSVVQKTGTPPSGDKHDYMSQAPYFRPNPETTNHLPYIRRDGQRNPEINKFSDHRVMDEMVDAVETLALAYYFEGEESCGVRACTLLRA